MQCGQGGKEKEREMKACKRPPRNTWGPGWRKKCALTFFSSDRSHLHRRGRLATLNSKQSVKSPTKHISTMLPRTTTRSPNRQGPGLAGQVATCSDQEAGLEQAKEDIATKKYEDWIFGMAGKPHDGNEKPKSQTNVTPVIMAVPVAFNTL